VFGKVSYYWAEDLWELMSVVAPIVFNFSFFYKVSLVLQMMMSIGKEHVLLLHQFKKCNCLMQHTIALIVLNSYIRRPPPLDEKEEWWSSREIKQPQLCSITTIL
jgi:hypothetical protein